MALIRLRERAGWSEPLLVAHTTLLEIACCGSYVLREFLLDIQSYFNLCFMALELSVKLG